MIVQFIFTALVNFFESVFDGLHIDSIPSELVSEAQTTMGNMISNAENLIDLVLPYNQAKLLLVITLTIEAVVGLYSLVMWVLRKIPVVSIS